MLESLWVWKLHEHACILMLMFEYNDEINTYATFFLFSPGCQALMSPSDYSENEYLMRCMVKTITTAEVAITPHAGTLINALG